MKASVEYLLDELAHLVEPSLAVRRMSLREQGDASYMPDNWPMTEDEIDAFLQECLFENSDIHDALLEGDLSAELELEKSDLRDFHHEVAEWAENQNWIAADGPFFLVHPPKSRRPSKAEVESFSGAQLTLPLLERLEIHAPTLRIVRRLLDERIDLNNMDWRELEKLTAELLEADGWEVDLQRGTKDGGADLLAFKDIQGIGPIKSVW